MAGRKDPEFINTLAGVAKIVDFVDRQDTWKRDIEPPLYIDLEGEQLGRNGSVSLMTVLVYPGEGLECIYVIDIYILGNAAFEVVGERGKSLKDILEAPERSKVLFDVRRDSEALFAHYGVNLRGVWDLQLMDSAARPRTEQRMLLSGLAKCMQFVPLTNAQKNEWALCKERGDRVWNPDKGGSYNAFNQRPLPAEILRYCAGDVAYLPAMYKKYASKSTRWRNFVFEASQKRVVESQGTGVQPEGRERALSPWTAEEHRMLDSWTEVNPRGGLLFAISGR
ncbi:3'-5' exonuclease domain-containing protein [Trichoderma breve]|uniref:3'-5' exonuclease domain-containing protein n=1 Tax=Trichoderma breve TaxID=2034170 RepID=A0A9W9BA09_9HYPO|nr:3'-5' exonuclease domain-containing protein [Trichoderma breve]KAJ4858704.1 3'-5' exonuclease domain-containing protein [Trichoderma breve]